MAEQRNEGTLLCFVCRLRLNHEVGSCNIRIQLAVERRSFAIPGERIPPLGLYAETEGAAM
jgi:hypothetical protein